MKNLMKVWLLLLVCILPLGTACQDNKKKETTKANLSLIEKDLPEIKQLVNGKWELVSGKNAREFCEYLNWRKADTGLGYEAYLMDVFYETNPAFPLSIKGDTLFLQDCSETGYKYTLVRK